VGASVLWALALASGVAALGLFGRGKDAAQKPTAAAPAPAGPAVREPDALYQKGKFAGRAVSYETDEVGNEVRFDLIENTDDLLLPDEFEFQKYILLVRKVASATKVAHESPQKGRILQGVVAEIVGYREH